MEASFYYFKDSIVSYILHPGFPDEKLLQAKYKKWYSDKFKFTEDHIKPHLYRFQELFKPLDQYEGNVDVDSIPMEILSFISPTSGLYYDSYKRNEFIELGKSLTPEIVELVMYSINFAARLTGIEYYLKNKKDFTKTEKLDDWIEQNYRQIPTIRFMSGCNMSREDTREVMEMYLKE